MARAAESPEERAKREVFAAVQRIVKLTDSGKEAAEQIWSETLGNFFEHATRAPAKWHVERVHDYAMRAVREIAHEANRLSGGGPAGRSHLSKAAVTTILKYRPPPKVSPKGSSELCNKFRIRLD